MKKKIIFLIGMCLFVSNVVSADDYLDLGEINVLASRSNVNVLNLMRDVSVITREDIERSTATSIPEAMKSQGGIFVADYLGNPKGVNIDIRGFGETSKMNILVLVDGRRTNQVDLSGADWGQINLDSVERIEILKGPSTVLYGDNASAGVVNIITKKGYQDSKSLFRIGTEIGSYQHMKSFLSMGATIKDLDYFFNYTHQQSSGYRANNDYWSNDYLGNFDISIAEKVSLGFSSGYHKDRYGMPGALFASDVSSVGRKGTKYPDDKGWTSDFFVNMTPKVDFLIKDTEVEFSSGFSYRKRDNKSLSVSSWGRYETLHQINSFEVRPKVQFKSEVTDGIKNNTTLGFDFFDSKDNIRSGNQSSAQDFVDIKKQTFGIYGLENIEFNEKFLTSFGGRATWAFYDFDQKSVSVNKDTRSISEGAFNFGLGYKYNDRSQVYFDYSRSFRLPATDEYYQNVYAAWGGGGGLNADLKHQTSHNYEIGIRDVSLSWLMADASIFLMDVFDEIYYDPLTNKNSNYDPQARHYGFEASTKVKLFKEMLEPFISWTYQDAFFKGGTYSGNKVPFVPRNIVSAGISVDIFDKLTTMFSADYVDKCFAISDQANNQPKLNSHVTFNFKADYQYKNVKFWFSVKNIFDRMYDAYGVYSSGSDQIGFYPAEGRSFYSGVSFEF